MFSTTMSEFLRKPSDMRCSIGCVMDNQLLSFLVLSFLGGRDTCVASVASKALLCARNAMPERFWRMECLKMWPELSDADVYTEYNSYMHAVLDRKHNTSCAAHMVRVEGLSYVFGT
jgi:hypothetical protein